MQIALSRKIILVILLVIAVIFLVISFLFSEKGILFSEKGKSATEVTHIPDVRATTEARMMTPMAWTMTDGVQAVTGRATFVGESGDAAYITVQSGELEFIFMVTPRTGVFSTGDVYAHPNQPAPTVENPKKALRNLHDTPVLVRYEPGDPHRAYSILITGDDQ
ncbi:hypothetical protein [Thermogutta sp.]|uniref:hypothetical protein n=1 Tax=Thermogutta sp. TaxID=1962930 RepID=UPI0032206030